MVTDSSIWSSSMVKILDISSRKHVLIGVVIKWAMNSVIGTVVMC